MSTIARFIFFIFIILAVGFVSKAAHAAEDVMLVVSDIMVDQAAENAVIARDRAIEEARRSAFRKLAEKHMSAEAATALQTPDDKKLRALVQDFEIRGEQMTRTRYAASFTVRFRSAVRQYIPVPYAEVATSLDPAVAPVAQGAAGGQVLLLPYLETISGARILWDDPNPWRRAWLEGRVTVPADVAVTLPLGDISDVSAGDAAAVWRGNYGALDKLAQNYSAGEVLLAVANKSGNFMTVEMYVFTGGKLLRLETLTPFTQTLADDDAFRVAGAEVVRYLQRRKTPATQVPAPDINAPDLANGQDPRRDVVAGISRSLTGGGAVSAMGTPSGLSTTVIDSTTSSVVAQQQVAPAGGTAIEARMAFADFSAWVDAQRRISSIRPQVAIDIRSLNRGGAEFVLRYDGGPDALKQALAAQGIVLAPGSGGQTYSAGGQPVFDLRVVN